MRLLAAPRLPGAPDAGDWQPEELLVRLIYVWGDLSTAFGLQQRKEKAERPGQRLSIRSFCFETGAREVQNRLKTGSKQVLNRFRIGFSLGFRGASLKDCGPRSGSGCGRCAERPSGPC